MPHLWPDFYETLSECLFWQYLGQVWISVLSGDKVGNQVKSYEILVYTLAATFATLFWWNWIRIFVLTISRPSLNMGYVGSKTRLPGLILKFLVSTIEARLTTRFWWNLIRMFVLTIFRPSLNMRHVGLKGRPPGQFWVNSCLHSRDHSYDQIWMNIDQNVCLSNI